MSFEFWKGKVMKIEEKLELLGRIQGRVGELTEQARDLARSASEKTPDNLIRLSMAQGKIVQAFETAMQIVSEEIDKS